MNPTPEMLRIMPREMRMMSERILSLTNLPKGFALMVGDVVMYSQAMGFGGFALLELRLDDLKPADPSKISLIAESGQRIELDGGGQHAWFVVPSLIDLLQLKLADHDLAEAEVVGVVDPGELGIAEGLGRRAGMELSVTDGFVTARKTAPGDPVLDRVLADGCRMPAELWWRIYAIAQTALTPDSVVSRRHAGPVIVTEDGKVIGRTDNDDDTDVNFISSVGAGTEKQEKTA
ncbi:hypothetical protein [Pseudoruegeria sp. HB172150]|uniref:hypothetical protein n=1 Tax=Pseudoruegeria sp. HB172150 TaxID=2721164 RepID=UPI0015538448|nr:hypothetical protein [Pseudoruegeria sp. HB172150]